MLEPYRLLLDRCWLAGGRLGCVAAFGLLSVTSVWGAGLTVAVDALEIDMSTHAVNFAGVQLVYATDEDTTGSAQLPFELYVVGTDHKDQRARALSTYLLTDNGWQQRISQTLASEVTLLQLVAAAESPQFLAYGGDTLSRLNSVASAFQPLFELPSIYRANAVELDAEIDFARELTGDDLDDLLVPDFDGWRFSAAKADGTFSEPQLFGPRPLMNVGTARYVNFTANTPYVFDHNQDGQLDVAFWEGDALQVYYQNEAAVFSTTPVRMAVTPNIESDAFFSLSVGDDAVLSELARQPGYRCFLFFGGHHGWRSS